ncbi:MAG: YceI family protein [Verrucomicrobiota bacterium]|nr:YceI family protein [Verrucomicrobiota bacterium]
MKNHVIATLFSIAAIGALSAAPQTFDFKDPKGVNAIQFHLDSVLEPISGTASGITGTVSFDPANPAATTGKIVVATNSLTVSNAMMTDHLRGDRWLNAPVNPEISFELAKLDNVKTSGNDTTATAVGKLSIKGVTKDVSVPVKLTYLAGAFGKRINKPEVGGDLLVVRGEFTINRSDYGINPGQMEDKVNPEIKLTLAIVGGAPKA